MSQIVATSFEFDNNGSTIFTVTKPGGTNDTISPGTNKTYNPKGVYTADVSGVQAFSISFDGNLTITKGTGLAPPGTSATIRTYMN